VGAVVVLGAEVLPEVASEVAAAEAGNPIKLNIR
jgi:Sec-independent protein translocase protein TatA